MELESTPPSTSPLRPLIIGLKAFAALIMRRWLWFINGFFALLLAGALITPIFMQIGWTAPANVLYTVYSFTCHQLPERSYFMFTPDAFITTYSKDQVVAAGADPASQLTLREFVGTPEVGYKAAFSDRMFSMYGGALIGGLVYAWLARGRRWVEPLPILALILMALPMGLDGLTHLISDLPGHGLSGFRDINSWAFPIFGNQPAGFYTESTTWTLNAWLRLFTGLLFGVAIALFSYPYLGMGFYDIQEEQAESLPQPTPAL